MSKRFFLLLATIVTFILCSSYVFAENSVIGNSMNDMGTQVKDSWNKAGNSMQNAGNAVRTGITNVGDMITGNDSNNDNISSGNNSGYTAERTATSADAPTLMGMTSTMWTWLIFGILAVALVSVVWFYGMQHQDAQDRKH